MKVDVRKFSFESRERSWGNRFKQLDAIAKRVEHINAVVSIQRFIRDDDHACAPKMLRHLTEVLDEKRRVSLLAGRKSAQRQDARAVRRSRTTPPRLARFAGFRHFGQPRMPE